VSGTIGRCAWCGRLLILGQTCVCRRRGADRRGRLLIAVKVGDSPQRAGLDGRATMGATEQEVRPTVSDDDHSEPQPPEAEAPESSPLMYSNELAWRVATASGYRVRRPKRAGHSDLDT